MKCWTALTILETIYFQKVLLQQFLYDDIKLASYCHLVKDQCRHQPCICPVHLASQMKRVNKTNEHYFVMSARFDSQPQSQK